MQGDESEEEDDEQNHTFKHTFKRNPTQYSSYSRKISKQETDHEGPTPTIDGLGMHGFDMQNTDGGNIHQQAAKEKRFKRGSIYFNANESGGGGYQSMMTSNME